MSFDITVSGGLVISFTKEQDDNYNIQTTYEELIYECNSFLKPIGKKSIEIVEKFLKDDLTKYDVKIRNDCIMLEITHIFLDEKITLLLKREEINDIEFLHKQITKVRQQNKELKDSLSIVQQKLHNMEEKKTQYIICDVKRNLYFSDKDVEEEFKQLFINQKYLSSICCTEINGNLWNTIKGANSINETLELLNIYVGLIGMIDFLNKSKKYRITNIDCSAVSYNHFGDHIGKILNYGCGVNPFRTYLIEFVQSSFEDAKIYNISGNSNYSYMVNFDTELKSSYKFLLPYSNGNHLYHRINYLS